MNAVEVTKLYFDLSNMSDFTGISDLLSDETIYKSQNTGEYIGSKDILHMQKTFHGKFKQLSWKINSIVEQERGVVCVDYDFQGTLSSGESLDSSGFEYVTVLGDRITRIEIQNK